jgi:hypothetical protein
MEPSPIRDGTPCLRALYNETAPLYPRIDPIRDTQFPVPATPGTPNRVYVD